MGRNARLVGNFRSEKELFELFSRFAGNVRALPPFAGEAPPPAPRTVEAEVQPPGFAEGNGGAAAAAAAAGEPFRLDDELDEDEEDEPAASDGESPDARALPPAELPDALSLALLLLEQENAAGISAASGRRSLAQLLRLLRDGEVDTLRHTYKTLFARLGGGGEPVRRARKAVGGFFDAEIERGG